MLPTIHIKLRKDKQKKGESAIVLQVYHNRKQRQVFTGYYIAEKYFQDGKVVKHPNARMYNDAIEAKRHALVSDYLKQDISGKPIELTPAKAKTTQSVYDYGVNFFRSKKNTATPDYVMRCIYKLDHFKEFAGDISFKDLTPELLRRYEDHCFRLELSRNYVSWIFSKLKEVCKDAVKTGAITESPFRIYRAVTYKQTERTYLTVDEVAQLASADIDPRLHTIRDFFLLACHTGLRYSDMSRIDIVTNKGVERLIIGTTKTGETVSIKVTPTVKELITRLKGKKIFTNKTTNDYLKIIGKAAKITKRLTFHVARHSAAVNMASAGISVEVVARLLGHTSIKTTGIYYKIIDTKLDEAMDRFEEFNK